MLTIPLTKASIFIRFAILSVTNVKFVNASETFEELTKRKLTLDVFCSNNSCNREKCQVFGCHVLTLGPVHGCGKCGT